MLRILPWNEIKATQSPSISYFPPMALSSCVARLYTVLAIVRSAMPSSSPIRRAVAPLLKNLR